MRQVRLSMGMPIAIEIVGEDDAVLRATDRAFMHFVAVDERFSTYKEGSEISRINRGELLEEEWSDDMRTIMALAERTKKETNGYFNIRRPDGSLDPSGVVKGWAIRDVARLLVSLGQEHFYVDAGGDIQVHGEGRDGIPWSVGIRNPFAAEEIVKVLYPKGAGVATSGSYVRGAHIYNPHDPQIPLTDVVSLTVIGPDVCEADRFATAAFAMGREGITFIESLPLFEGYLIDHNGVATLTTGFTQYLQV